MAVFWQKTPKKSLTFLIRDTQNLKLRFRSLFVGGKFCDDPRSNSVTPYVHSGSAHIEDAVNTDDDSNVRMVLILDKEGMI